MLVDCPNMECDGQVDVPDFGGEVVCPSCGRTIESSFDTAYGLQVGVIEDD